MYPTIQPSSAFGMPFHGSIAPIPATPLFTAMLPGSFIIFRAREDAYTVVSGITIFYLIFLLFIFIAYEGGEVHLMGK